MEHDVYYQRQCALIERSLQSQREEEELRAQLASYRHEKAARKANFKLQRTKRSNVVRNAKMRVEWKSDHATYSKGERAVYRTRRFKGSHVTVYCKCRPC
ncbi:MAG: hypothetical protein ACOCNX_00625 [Prevotella sp.]